MLTRLIIIIAMFAAALILGTVLVWPKYQDFQQVQSELEQKKSELDSKVVYYSKIREIGERLNDYDDVLSKIDTALPAGYSIPVLFNYLQKTAGETGLVLEDISWGGITGEEIKEIGVNLEVSGSYSSLRSFLQALENSVRFFKVKSISFSSKEGERALSFDLGIATYSY